MLLEVSARLPSRLTTRNREVKSRREVLAKFNVCGMKMPRLFASAALCGIRRV
jgi:hypothetical protein